MDAEVLTVVVEIPKGSRNKYEMDHETGDRVLGPDAVHLDAIPRRLRLHRPARSAATAIRSTRWCSSGESTFPGCHIRVRPIGLFRMTDEKGEDEKVLCVPLRDPMWSHVDGLEGIPQPLLDEIEHFFQVYKDLEGHKVPTDGFEDRVAAERVIAEARARHEG